MVPAPIALFVYNRPELAHQTLLSLAQNALLQDSELYIFCDGPKPNATKQQLENIQRTREVIRARQWSKNVRIVEAPVNKGLANSIIDGVTQVVNTHGKVIVLEDDLTVSPYFLQFMNEALCCYAEEEKVLAVHGYLYPIQLPASITTETFFIRDPGNLGWATWKRSWDLFERDSRKLQAQLQKSPFKEDFNFWGGYPFLKMLQKQIDGKIDSWAIRWRAVAYLYDKLTLHPFRSLVRHEGNVAAATHHYTMDDFLYTVVYQQPVGVAPIPLRNEWEVERRFASFLRKHAGLTLTGKLKNTLKKYWRKFIYHA